MIFLDEIRDYLIDQSVVEGSTGWGCYIGYLPPNEQSIELHFVYGEVNQETEDKIYYVEVIGRGGTLHDLIEKMYEIYNALNDGNIGETETRSYIYSYAMSSNPDFAGYDENHNPVMSWEFKIMAEAL